MRCTIRNWKNLGEVLANPKFKTKPVEIEFYNGKLFEITFETKKNYVKQKDSEVEG